MARDVQEQLHRILTGDRSAAAWLYDTFSPYLFRRLSQRYGDLSSEDLLQDSFVLFFQNDYRVLRRFLDRVPAPERTGSRLERYLWDQACGVATNRRRSRAARHDVPLPAAAEVSIEPTAERRSIDRQRLARLDGCLKGGSRRAYLYFKLRYVDGYAPREISRITGWSQKATYKLKQVFSSLLERCLELLGWAPVLLIVLGTIACSVPEPASRAARDLDVVLRGYQQVIVRDDGTLLPLYLGRRGPFKACLQPAAAEDTSQWQARLLLNDRREPEQPFRAPAVRMVTTLCFEREIPEDLPAAAELGLCVEVRDRHDQSRFELPCQELRHEADDTALRAARKARAGLWAQAQNVGELLDGLDLLAEQAEGLPFERVAIQLMATHELRQQGTPEALAAARRRLADLPAWLAQPEASRWAAQVAMERARLELREGNFRSAWQLLNEADRLFLRDANPKRIAAAWAQAQVLAHSGAPREAVERLRSAIEDCGTSSCNRLLLADARSYLAWLIQVSPESRLEDLEQGEQDLLEVLDQEASIHREAAERATLLVNLAYIRHLQGQDPGPDLARVRDLLESGQGGGTRASLLLGWATFVEALAALSRGDAGRSLELCEEVLASRPAADSGPRELTAWAFSCAGRSHRRLGDLDAARHAFERALLLHDRAGTTRMGEAIVLGPGQWADDYYRAARVEVERGEPERAWQLLARLDRRSLGEEQLRRCRERMDAPARRALRDHEARRRELWDELSALDRPASGKRRRQLEPVRRELKQELQELWWQQPGCPELPPASREAVLRYRAVALDDEVLLLHRDTGGSVVLERRRPLARAELLRILERIHAALGAPSLDDAAWIELVQPLARALVPEGELPAVTPYALHGVLQHVPLAALPLAGDPGSEGTRWLGEATLPVLRPAGAPDVPSGSREASAPPLFVVDPSRNLASSAQLLAVYRDLFPRGRFLIGEAATLAALRSALDGSRWLHVDAHGQFDPAFPELSHLALADQPLTLLELSRLEAAGRWWLVNLSGCQTGRWPTTADSGRYGLAGSFARRGVRWVIATRADLPDRLAADFNRAFYRSLGPEAAVPEAFSHAMIEVRRSYPAAAWASLMLLQGGKKRALSLPLE